MLRIVQALRSNISDEALVKSIDTLHMLLKAWQKAHHSDALSIVRNCKISWSSVLFKGAPTEVIKGKKNKPDQTVIRSPPKPSRSPWLASSERSELGNYYKDLWSKLDKIRETWVALDARQQHKDYNTVVGVIKRHYEQLNNISNSVHAKLGKRKNWIERMCRESGFKPKTKKDQSESFLLAAHFFSLDLTKLDNSVKRIFAPITYLPDTDGKQTETWSRLIPDKGRTTVDPTMFSLDDEGDSYRLWQIWADIFHPVFDASTKQIPEAPVTEDRNIFTRLLSLRSDT
jgi:hypothetical protein